MTAQPEQLPSGRYRAATYNPHGKRKGPSKTFDTYAEAFAWARRTEADMDRSIREHGIDVVRRGEPPTAGLKGPKQSKSAGRHRYITDDELDKILAELPEWLHAAVYLSRDSGLRIAEVCGLPWHRLDLLHGRVTVSDVVLVAARSGPPKGGAVYTVALTPRTVAALCAHQERWPAGKRDRVFREPGKGRELVMPTRVRDLWARARDAKKLKRQPTRDELDIAEYRAAQLACLLRGHHDAVDGEAVGPCLGLFGRSLLY